MKTIFLMVAAMAMGAGTGAAMPKVGDAAPDFSATASDGSTVTLKDFAGKSNVVLYFYPKDDTQGCTKEACGIRDVHGELNAVVFGVSADSVDSHKAFIKKYNLPFRLLADTEGKVRAAYGVTSRVTFIINKEGKIAFVFPSVNPSTHAAELRQALAQLAE